MCYSTIKSLQWSPSFVADRKSQSLFVLFSLINTAIHSYCTKLLCPTLPYFADRIGGVSPTIMCAMISCKHENNEILTFEIVLACFTSNNFFVVYFMWRKSTETKMVQQIHRSTLFYYAFLTMPFHCAIFPIIL